MRDYLAAVAQWAGLPFLGGALTVTLAHLYPDRLLHVLAAGAAYVAAVALWLWRDSLRWRRLLARGRRPRKAPGSSGSRQRRLYLWFDGRQRIRREWLTDAEAARVVPEPYRREVS